MDNLNQRFLEVSELLSNIDTFVLSIMGLALLGIVYDLVRKKRRLYKEIGANLAIGIGNILLGLTSYGLIFLITLWITEQIAFTKIPVNIWTWVMAILVADYLNGYSLYR